MDGDVCSCVQACVMCVGWDQQPKILTSISILGYSFSDYYSHIFITMSGKMGIAILGSCVGAVVLSEAIKVVFHST